MDAGIITDRYGRQIPAAMSARNLSFTELPVIDFAPMWTGDPEKKRALAKSLRDACINVGFFYLKNHRVPEDLILETFRHGKAFFALPLEKKMEIAKAKTPGFGGYSPMREMGRDLGKGDLNEAFNMNLELAADDPDVLAGTPFYDPNSWPSDMPAFRSALLAYFDAMLRLGEQLFRAFALALELPEGTFLPEISKPISMLRLNHYPTQDVVDNIWELGTSAHTDYECFTILAQDPNPELVVLQVVNGDGEWISVPHIPGTFVINIGDQMAQWTNDIFASTMHRVVNRTGKQRDSMAFFFGTDYETLMEPLTSCVFPDRPARYPAMKSGDYVLDRINGVYGYDLSKKKA